MVRNRYKLFLFIQVLEKGIHLIRSSIFHIRNLYGDTGMRGIDAIYHSFLKNDDNFLRNRHRTQGYTPDSDLSFYFRHNQV